MLKGLKKINGKNQCTHLWNLRGVQGLLFLLSIVAIKMLIDVSRTNSELPIFLKFVP